VSRRNRETEFGREEVTLHGISRSGSLSSLDSEEQDSIRAAERLHSRTNRSNTGGISTHSLNEAELAVSFHGKLKNRCHHGSGIGVIPCQSSKNKTKMSPWVENIKTDIFRGFYIQFEENVSITFFSKTSPFWSRPFWPKKGKIYKMAPKNVKT
jgi:hypothetical protein